MNDQQRRALVFLRAAEASAPMGSVLERELRSTLDSAYGLVGVTAEQADEIEKAADRVAGGRA